jgi:hypothetical protein
MPMKAFLVAVMLTAGFAADAAAAGPWGERAFRLEAQGEKRARGAPERERLEGSRDPRRADRRQERREHALTEEERRALHRDIDKADRELYRRRAP